MAEFESDSNLPDDASGERLQKVLAAAGFGSRRHCEEYILTGRVTVDGVVVNQLGAKVDPLRQKVAVDGERVKVQAKQYFLLNKPPGYLCTSADPSGRPRVIDLLPPSDTRVFTVGRLDENTEGLLLVTNDGELAHRLAHPKFQVERVYRVLVAGHPDPAQLDALQKGMFFTEGKFRVRQAKRLKTQGQSTLLEIVITEGHNREVRRLFARIGHKVMSLRRIQFGPLRLGTLELGEFRPLRGKELQQLQEFASTAPARRKRATRPEQTSGDSRGPRPASRRPRMESSEQRPGKRSAIRPRREDGPRGNVSGGPEERGRRPARRPPELGERPPSRRPPREFGEGGESTGNTTGKRVFRKKAVMGGNPRELNRPASGKKASGKKAAFGKKGAFKRAGFGKKGSFGKRPPRRDD